MLESLLNFTGYFAVALAALLLFAFTYALVTPYNEIKLIRDGNTAAALTYTGAIIGFVLPVASVIAHSVGLLDVAVWALVALIVQVIVFLVVRLIYRELAVDIPMGRMAPAMKLAGTSVAVGILNAACMTY